MKRTLLLAAFSCAAAFSQAHAANDAVTTTRSNEDLRARCEIMTGNHRLDCLEQLDRNQWRTPRTAEDRAARTEARREARESYADRAQMCSHLTGNLRMDCMQQVDRDGTRGTAQSTAQIRSEARQAYATPADRCEFITTNRRLDCLQQYGRRG